MKIYIIIGVVAVILFSVQDVQAGGKIPDLSSCSVDCTPCKAGDEKKCEEVLGANMVCLVEQIPASDLGKLCSLVKAIDFDNILGTVL